MKQKGIVYIIFILLVLTYLILFSYLFIDISSSPSNGVEPFNHKGGYILSERFSFFLRKPAIGDGIIFYLAENSTDQDYVGIIINIEEDKNIETYEVISTPEKTWHLSLDKIKRRIYFPVINKSQLEKLIAQSISRPTPSFNPDPTANWEVYNDNEYKIEFKYPQEWIINKIPNESDAISLNNPFNIPNINTPPYGVIVLKIQKCSNSSNNLNSCNNVYSTTKIAIEKRSDKNCLVTKDIIISNIPAYQISGVCGGEQQIPKTTIIPGKEKIISFTLENHQEFEDFYDQILSTFRFIE